jgi:hypothetical protein
MEWIILGIAVIAFMFLSGCNKKQPEPDPNLPDEAPRYRALFVGVSKYDNYEGAIDLKTPAPNTVKLNNLFVTFRFGKHKTPVEKIVKLTNSDASKQGIKEAILETFKDAKDNDVSYFYYMGHGNVRLGTPIITPADYKYTDFLSMITVHELKSWLDQIKGHKVILLETCHGGNFIERDARSAGADFNELTIQEFAKQTRDTLNRPPYQVITSSAGDQLSWENSFWKYSYFCKPFIEGCKDLTADYNDDGVVTLEEIHNYTMVWIAKQNLPEQQHPQIYPEGSEFPVAEYRS